MSSYKLFAQWLPSSPLITPTVLTKHSRVRDSFTTSCLPLALCKEAVSGLWKWWKFTPVKWLGQSKSIFKPTNHKRVMPANWTPCLTSHSKFYCHQARTVKQSTRAQKAKLPLQAKHRTPISWPDTLRYIMPTYPGNPEFIIIFRWLCARLQWLQCVSNGVTAVLP